MPPEEPAAKSWWGEFTLATDETACWTIGPLRLWVQRLAKEWRIAFEGDFVEGDDPDAWSVEREATVPADRVDRERFVVPRTGDTVTLRPLVADRPIVVRPHVALHVPSGERARIFVSSPVWVELAVGAPPRKLRELSVKRMSDTWFGPSTREGELAYALRTHARQELAEMPIRPHRVLTPVVIRNEADDILQVDRLNLPIPLLSVYAAADGVLWTEEITMRRGESSTMASLDVASRPSREAAGAVRLSGPRQVRDEGLLVRAFSSLLRISQPGDDG